MVPDDVTPSDDRRWSGPGARTSGREADGHVREVSFPLDEHAPDAARTFVKALDTRIPTTVLGDALLIASELVTNSVRHSGAAAGGVVLRIHLTNTTVRLEVEDRGRGSLVAARVPTRDAPGGFGLNIVHALSERWGFEHVAAGGTRVWACLPAVAR